MRRCKKLISALLCVIMLSSVVSAYAYDFTYDAADNSLSITESGAGANTIIVVKPYDDEELTVRYINEKDVIYKILSKGEGLPFKMLLFSETGRHQVKMSDGSESASYVINMADPLKFADLLTALGTQDADEALAVEDNQAFGTPFAGAADILAVSEPNLGYDADSLVKAYNLGEGLSRVSTGEITPVQFFSEYQFYLDDELAEEFENLNDKEIAALAKCDDAVQYPTLDVNFAADVTLFMARLDATKNSTEAKELCLDFIEKYDIDTETYDDINKAYYKDKVFSGIFSERADIKTVDDFTEAWEDNSKKQLKAYKDSQKEDGGGGTGGGGFVRVEDPANQEVVTPVIAFSDLEGHWAKSNILVMHERGIINGFTDGTFRPENNVTRAEFVKMLVAALKLEIGGAVQFDDVLPEDWHYAYIATAYNRGIVTGVGTGFNPDGAITRQDASVIVYRAIMAGAEDTGVTFNDEDVIADYAKAAVAALSAKGIILGSDGFFNPTNNMTRAEAATIIQRILQ